jgi:hypothetical protein
MEIDMDLFKLSAKIGRVKSVLISHGDCYSGGECNLTFFARQWVDRGFDAIDVDSWCSVNVWDAQAAKMWSIAGLTPDDVAAAAKLLLEKNGADSYTDGCPIYSCCNGDTDLDVIVDAHELLKEEGI